MRRNVSLVRVAAGRARRKVAGFKPYLWGAAAGGIAGSLLTVAAAGAQGLPAGPAIPKNLAIGAFAGILATFLGASPMLAALTAGTGIYVVNVMRAGASGGGTA